MQPRLHIYTFMSVKVDPAVGCYSEEATMQSEAFYFASGDTVDIIASSCTIYIKIINWTL